MTITTGMGTTASPPMYMTFSDDPEAQLAAEGVLLPGSGHTHAPPAGHAVAGEPPRGWPGTLVWSRHVRDGISW